MLKLFLFRARSYAPQLKDLRSPNVAYLLEIRIFPHHNSTTLISGAASKMIQIKWGAIMV